jgi:hypothetical protein
LLFGGGKEKKQRPKKMYEDDNVCQYHVKHLIGPVYAFIKIISQFGSVSPAAGSPQQACPGAGVTAEEVANEDAYVK